MHRFTSAFRLRTRNGDVGALSRLQASVSGRFHRQFRRFNSLSPRASQAPTILPWEEQDMSTKMKEYDDVQYWNKRYIDEGDDTFDWYQRYDELEPLLQQYIRKDSRILMSGCGNAVLSEEMVANGYRNEIVNIDFSAIVINIMRNKHRHIPELKYITMDARNLDTFEDNSFDAVFDKGLMDSLLCGSNGFIDVAFVLEETFRVLKPGGVFMLVTYGEPMLRMHHLLNPAFDWKIVLHVTAKPGTNVAIPEGYAEAIPMNKNWESVLSQCKLSDPDLNFVYVCTKASS